MFPYAREYRVRVRAGLKRTNEDKRKAVVALLSEPTWRDQFSDRKIAEVAAVAHSFVHRLRTEMFPGVLGEQVETPQSPTEETPAPEGASVDPSAAGAMALGLSRAA